MSVFDLQESLDRFAEKTGPARRRRGDRGRSRLHPEVRLELESRLQGTDRPPVRQVAAALAELCRQRGLRPPARSTIYEAMSHTPPRGYDISSLPPSVRDALYNLSGSPLVPGHQLAFYCLNYGDLAAISFAAGLPWLALYQAARLPGWRPKSAGLLAAIRRVRRI